MNFLHRIRLYFYQRELKRQGRVKARQHQQINWEKVVSIGVLFDASTPEQVVIANQFVQEMSLEGKQVELLGYVNTRASNFQNFSWFNRKNLNWYRKPRGPEVNHFMEKKFDLLLNAFQCPNLPLEYIASLSDACFRIGIYNEGNTSYNDLMINLKDGDDLDTFFREATHFCKMFNRDAEFV